MSLATFNRIVARELALALTTGVSCDQELVARCYEIAGRDAETGGRNDGDPLAEDIRMLCVTQDLDALQENEARLRRMSIAEAEAEVLRLLNPDLRMARSRSKPLVR